VLPAHRAKELEEVVRGQAVAARQAVGVLHPQLGLTAFRGELSGAVLRRFEPRPAVPLVRREPLIDVRLAHELAPVAFDCGATVGDLRRDRAALVGGGLRRVNDGGRAEV
jgi:hypothetical protein